MNTKSHLDFYAGIFATLSAVCLMLGSNFTTLNPAIAEALEPTALVIETEEVDNEVTDEIVETDISEETIETGEVTNELNEPELAPPKAYSVSSEYVVEVHNEPSDESEVIGYISNGEIVVASEYDDNFAVLTVGDDFAYISLECLEEYVVNIQPVQEVETVNTFTTTSSINSESGLTEDEISYLLEGSYMEDYAYLYYNAEKTHGINAYYMLAVSQLESGWGKSNAGLYYNNIFGLMTSSGGFQYFESKQDCVEYWLGLMDGYYFGRGLDSPYEIGPVYCTTGEWPTVICEYMNGLVSRVERYRQNKL